MNAIVVDDEKWLLKKFEYESSKLDDICLVGSFSEPMEAVKYCKINRVEVAFLDVEMPEMNGIQLAEKLIEMNPEVIIIYISAYEQYIAQVFKNHSADYYLLKPYTEEEIKSVVYRARLLSRRMKKRIYIETFGQFCVYLDGKILYFKSKKARELLALLVDRKGTTLSNKEAFNILYEDVPYDHTKASAYRKGLRRLKDILCNAGIPELLISSGNTHRLNTDVVDCDYYQFLEGKKEAVDKFCGTYMEEFSWGEETTAQLTFQKESIMEDKIGQAQDQR